MFLQDFAHKYIQSGAVYPWPMSMSGVRAATQEPSEHHYLAGCLSQQL